MIKSVYMTGRSLNERVKNLELVSNNLANINSIGYKKQIPFSEVLDKEGKAVIKDITDFTEGEKSLTANPFDNAITGEGYFLVKANNGELQVSRSGKFNLSNDGFLVNQEGNKVLGKHGEINLSAYQLNQDQKLTIDKTGEIKIGDEVIDKLAIVKPTDTELLERLSTSNFGVKQSEYVPVNESDYQISQGYLEESNVNAILEMESMIKINHEYESAHKVMLSLDDSLGKAIEIGKV
ncbi:MAG: flagellar hook-basal body complex protein [Bacteroidota bacterium]|nr:flagellar hook-basal body complex protein [Bacteroidota bacterium]